MLSRFEVFFIRGSLIIWFSGGEGLFFQYMKLVFLDIVKAFIFVTIESVFIIAIRPYM